MNASTVVELLGFHLSGVSHGSPPRLVSERGELVVERQAGSVGGTAASVMLLPPADLLEVAGKTILTFKLWSLNLKFRLGQLQILFSFGSLLQGLWAWFEWHRNKKYWRINQKLSV